MYEPLEWDTMLRHGAVGALDLDGYHPGDRCLDVRHRPETGTPIKIQEAGERMVALPQGVCGLLDNWIAYARHDVTDDDGREPLITTTYGRIGKTTPTKIVYDLTRPCRIGAPCPLDREPDEFEVAIHEHTSKCPESVSSHAVRRGAITHHLQSDVPLKAVSARANVGPDVLEKHYDRRTERTKMEQRRKFLRNL